MAFTVQAIKQGTTTNLYGRSPFSLIRFQGLGTTTLASVVRASPQLHGSVYLGYRAQPRYLTMELMILGASDSAVDTHRTTLTDIFQPEETTQLKITRDNGDIRYLDVRLADDILDYPVSPLERHAAAQLFVRIPLVAFSPAFYADTWTTSSFNTQAGDYSNAYYAIPNADINFSVLNPSADQNWSDDGAADIGTKKPWSLGMFSTDDTAGQISFRLSSSTDDLYCIVDSSLNYFLGLPHIGERDTGLLVDDALRTYIFVCDGDNITCYRLDLNDGLITGNTLPWLGDFPASTGVWRSAFAGYGSDGAAILRASVINKALTTAQISAFAYSLSLQTDFPVTNQVVYTGSWPSYPIITLEAGGSNLVDAIIYNTTRNKKLDFNGSTISANTKRIIDTRPGNRTVIDETGASKLGELTTDSNLDDFYLAPGTELTGGENGFAVDMASGATPTLNITYDLLYWGM